MKSSDPVILKNCSIAVQDLNGARSVGISYLGLKRDTLFIALVSIESKCKKYNDIIH
jgi:hypothetical protein